MKFNILYTISLLVLGICCISPAMGQESCPELTQRTKFLSTEFSIVAETISNLNNEKNTIESEMNQATSEQLQQLTEERDNLISRINAQNRRQERLMISIGDVGTRIRRNCE